MFKTRVITRFSLISPNFLKARNSTAINIKDLEKQSAEISVEDDELKRKEEQIEQKRNKSRLKPHDRNFLYESNPHPEPICWYQGTLKYNRRLYGRYGAASGVNPAICWPVKDELQEAIEYEQVAYPFTIHQMMEEAQKKRHEKNEKIRLKQEDVVTKMAKLDGWKRDLANKIAKKESEAMVAKERKQRLMDEVRAHFGFTVDPKEDRFKEMLEKKEKEQKKAMKEERKKTKEAEIMAKMLSKKKQTKNEEKQEENL